MITSSALIAYYMHQVTMPWNYNYRPYNQRPPAIQRTIDPVGAGHLEVTTTTVQPGGSIPKGSQRVPVMEVTLRETSCQNDVTVFGLDLQRTGPGPIEDIARIYAESGWVRLSRGRTLQSDGQVQINLRRYSIPACGSDTIIVYADFADNSSVVGQHRFILDRRTGGIQTPNASVSYGFNQQPAPVYRLPARRSNEGQISVTFPSISTNRVKVGRDSVVGRVRLEVEGRQDKLLTAIRFTNRGTANDHEITDFYLETNRGEVLSAFTEMVDDMVYLQLTKPLHLASGNTYTFNVRAVPLRSGGSINLVVEQPSDVQSFSASSRRRRF